MKKTRKILAAFLAILFTMGALTFSVFAEGTAAGNENMQVVLSTQQNADLGEIITVTINVTNNYYATNMRWPILFTKSVFELIGTDGEATVAGDTVPVSASGQLAATGSSIMAVDATANPTAGANPLYPTGYSTSKYSALLIQWVGNINNSVVNCYKSPSGYNCITFQLKVKEGTTATSGLIAIPSADTDTFYYQAMNNPADANTIYVMNNITCPMTFTNATVTIKTDKPDIGAVAGTTTIIQRFSESDVSIYGFDGFIYNMAYDIIYSPISSVAELQGYIEPLGGASLVITKMVGKYVYSTGTKIEVVYEGATIATYYLVVFGDIDGDGTCDGTDFTMIDSATQYLCDFTSSCDVCYNAQYYACDLSGDFSCDGGDFTMLDSVVQGSYLVSQDHLGTLIYL